MRIAFRRGGNVCILAICSVTETESGIRIIPPPPEKPITLLCEPKIKQILLKELLYTGVLDLTKERQKDPFAFKAKYDKSGKIYVSL